jgi:hypothetical protein
MSFIPQRILLCRPQGGLTDILSQIGKCCRYAAMFDRTVVVETNFLGTTYFRDDFSNYFVSHDSSLILSSLKFASQFEDLKAVPAKFSGRINHYSAKYNDDLAAFAEVDCSDVTSFNFGRNYDEPLLLHHSAGGGLRKAEISLRRLSITPMLRQCVEHRLNKIGGAYTSIHIRHTDYSTDYRSRILRLQHTISGAIFVATDNREALDFCRNTFGADRVFNFSHLPEKAGSPIHSAAGLDARQSNLDAIVDLLLLALASAYYYFPINENNSSAAFSGFSLLADLLHKDRKLLAQFVSSTEFGLTARLRLHSGKAYYRGLGWVKSIMRGKS